MSYDIDTDDAEGGGHSELLAKLLVPLGIASHLLFYDVVPGSLVWIAGSREWLDLFSAFDNPALRRLAGLGVFLSILAAVITTESVTRMARPFRVRHFFGVTVLFGIALFPSLADWHRFRLGLAPEQYAIVQSYCYLTLRVTIGVLIGATVSWILLASNRPMMAHRQPQFSRK